MQHELKLNWTSCPAPGTVLSLPFLFTSLIESTGAFTIAPTVWIYFVITIPITVIIVSGWWLWDRSRERQYAREDIDLEDQIEGMESKIMATMRRRTMNKVRTWTQTPEKVE